MHLVVVSGWTCAGKSTIADALGDRLPATVVSFDWVMSGLRSFPDVWDVIELPVERQREIGWTLISRVAEQQLRRGASVVLDLVARQQAIAEWRALADRYTATWSVIECFCPDETVHRRHSERRDRAIPAWYELSWEQIERTRNGYQPLLVDKLELDAANALDVNVDRALAHVTGAR